MPSITSLVTSLARDFPQLTFKPDAICSWSPTTQTIYYQKRGQAPNLLHELAHALLEHTAYTHDITLLEMERDAWHCAQATLAPRYGVMITDMTVETALDTYRDWLHARSVCPVCASSGLQTAHRAYTCLACGETWRVNDARVCSLRRYKIKKT